MTETIKLKCETCEADYEKPVKMIEWNDSHPTIKLYKWHLRFCDKCRREKEMNALKNLPMIIEALSKKDGDTV